jgi:hypothetical protein
MLASGYIKATLLEGDFFLTEASVITLDASKHIPDY